MPLPAGWRWRLFVCFIFFFSQTHASDFQMLRGSVVVFTGLASYLFLGRKLLRQHYVGMVSMC